MISIFETRSNSLYLLEKAKIQLLMLKGPQTWCNRILQLQHVLEGLNLNEDNNLVSLQIALTYINEKVFLPLIEKIETANHSTLALHKEDIEYQTTIITKISTFIMTVVNTDRDCIFCQERDSPDWQRLSRFIEHHEIDSEKNLDSNYRKFKHLITVGSAYNQLGQRQDIRKLIKPIQQSLGGLYYLLNPEQSRKFNISAITNPTLDYTVGIWSIMENNAIIKTFVKSVLVSVKYNQKMYLPRLFEAITLDLINDENIEKKPYEVKEFTNLVMSKHDPHRELTDCIKQKNRQIKIKVRLLSANKHIVRKHPNHEGAIQQYLKLSTNHHNNSFLPQQENHSKIKKIVLHIHGGGWVSMSSFSHQMYTRKWANILGEDCLIISIDYRLAPQYKYPCALDDCWQVYAWTVTIPLNAKVYFAEFYLNVKPEKIVIAGDSAGGNMALGICQRAIRLGVRLPDALLLFYPALNLHLDTFTPSYLFALTDTITPFTTLTQVITAYMEAGMRPDIDPYLSPGIVDESFLKLLPDKIRIVCGGLDPLKDECLKFMLRYIKARNLDEPSPYPKMHIVNGLGHGFLNYDIRLAGIPQVAAVNEQIALMIKESLS